MESGMYANCSPFLIKFATVEQVFQPEHGGFIPALLDLDAYAE